MRRKMSDQIILQKAIEKAENNGWRKVIPTCYESHSDWILAIATHDNDFEDKKHYSIIFSHDFAKAFFGTVDDKECDRCKTDPNNFERKWRIHLQRMVLEEEPLQYLKQFLDD